MDKNDGESACGHNAAQYYEAPTIEGSNPYFCGMEAQPRNHTARHIASLLLSTGAVELRPLQPFTWASGWLSPIYCDNRVTLSDVTARSTIKEALAYLVKEKFPSVGAIAGVATAGIAQGALVADALQLPFLYVRPQPKTHGKGKQVEGRIVPGQGIVLIEDLVSTGGSSIKAAQALTAEGAHVLGLISIFSYGFALADTAFASAGIPFYALSDYDSLLQEAGQTGAIPAHLLPMLQAWRQAPAEWGNTLRPDELESF